MKLSTSIDQSKSVSRKFLGLALMMFLQYMIFAIWWVPLAAYLTKMNVGDMQKALILSSMAFGCIAAPFVGMLADRFFRGQYVLAICNLVTSVLLLFSGMTDNPTLLFIYLIVAMIFYMPTWGLTSSIAMIHLPTEIFARVRVFGTVGWVISGIFSLFFIRILQLDFDGTNYPFYCAAAIAFIAFLTNLGLPNTTPRSKGEPISFVGLLGLRTLKLMKDRNFFWFIILSFLSMIPFSIYWSYGSEFLLDKGFKYITITMNMGQLFEMLFIITVPFIVKKYGLRGTMILGLVAFLIRYVAFLTGSVVESGLLYMLGIIVHGIIFGYFYLCGQMYIEKKAPKDLKSEGQGFIFLVTFGLGLIVGNFINSKIIGNYTSMINGVKSYNWDMIWGITSVISLFLLFMFVVLFRKEKLSNE